MKKFLWQRPLFFDGLEGTGPRSGETNEKQNNTHKGTKSAINLKVRFILKSGNYSPHNIQSILVEMVDDINSRAFEQETDVSLKYDYVWRDYSSCGEDGSCFLQKIADAEGMPGGDRNDDITFYMYLVDGRIKYYDQVKEKWVWVVGLSKGPNPQDAYSTFPAEVVQYQYYSSASDTAYHTGQTAVHEMTHDLGHPGHDNGRRGCWACYKDYNLMHKSSSPTYGRVTYWFTAGTEETINLVAPLAAQQD